MPASNTKDCFRAFIGHKVKGVLFDALPMGRCDLADGNKTLVFDDGRGLTIANNGSYWVESAEDVREAISTTKKRLQSAKKDIEDVLQLTGAE